MIARRAYCVGTPLIFLFVRLSVCLSVRLSVCLSVCLSVHTQFWTPSESNCTAQETIRGQKRVRLGHFAIAHLIEDKPNVPLAYSRLSPK